MSKKKKKFDQIWASQTDLGKHFGLSAIAVGKILIENGLKDLNTKAATSKALEDGFAVATPLKDGLQHFMWNRQKISLLLSQKHSKLSEVDFWADNVRTTIKAAEREMNQGNDKIGCLMLDCAFDDVPKNIREAVENAVGVLP